MADNLEWLCQWCGGWFNDLSEHFPHCPARPAGRVFPERWSNAHISRMAREDRERTEACLREASSVEGVIAAASALPGVKRGSDLADGFDKKAYQRELMRKRRAVKKGEG